MLGMSRHDLHPCTNELNVSHKLSPDGLTNKLLQSGHSSSQQQVARLFHHKPVT